MDKNGSAILIGANCTHSHFDFYEYIFKVTSQSSENNNAINQSTIFFSLYYASTFESGSNMIKVFTNKTINEMVKCNKNFDEVIRPCVSVS